MPKPASSGIGEQDAVPSGATEQADFSAERAARASRGAQGASAHIPLTRRARLPAATTTAVAAARERLGRSGFCSARARARHVRFGAWR